MMQSTKENIRRAMTEYFRDDPNGLDVVASVFDRIGEVAAPRRVGNELHAAQGRSDSEEVVTALHACLYHRRSTLDQRPDLAREELRAAAKARGMEVVLEVEETGSGARNDRPGLQRVLDAARRGQIQAVLTWKLDRFGRSALDLLTNIKVLEDCGARFIAITQGIDIRPDGDPMSKLLVTMLAAIANFELDLIRERSRLGVAKARCLGKRIGRPRKGAAPDAATVASLRAAGASWSAIARKLGCTPSAARRACQNGEAAPTA